MTKSSKITIHEFWTAQKILDAKYIITAGEMNRTSQSSKVKINKGDLIFQKAGVNKMIRKLIGT